MEGSQESSERFRVDTMLEFKGHERSISSIKFSPDGQLLASASSDMTVRIWKVDTGACIAILKGHTRGISDVAWAPDSLHLATASDDTLIHLWSLPPSASASASAGPVEVAPCKVLQGHTNYVFCVEFGPTGGMLASGSFDESVRFWDVRAGKVGAGGGERAVAAHADPVTSVAFGPDGSILASCSYDGLIRIWDSSTGRCIKTIVDDDNPPLSSIRFSRNGKYLLAATLDDTVRLWHVSSGRCVKSYRGHQNRRYCIPANYMIIEGVGEMVVMGSEDGRLVGWELNERRMVVDVMVHERPVMAVAVHPTRPMVATGALEPDLSMKLHHVSK